MNTQRQYPTDLTDKQWQLIHPLLPIPKWRAGGPGRKPLDLRLVMNGILYLTKTGCQWRMLPLEYGKWKSIHGYFNTWSKNGIWQRVQGALAQKERHRQGRKSQASAGCVDSQSVKTATQGKRTGYDANKKVNGRKRHVLVDTLGLIISVFVSSADCPDSDGLKRLLVLYLQAGYKRLRKLWVDGGYRGDALKTWVSNLKQTYKIDLEVVARTEPGFAVLPRRWVVERTFAWLFNFRRLSKDYEVLTRNSEAFIHIAMTQVLLRRLA